MIDSEELKDMQILKDATTFSMWEAELMIFFRSKDLGEIADGTEKCPTETKEKKIWSLKDNKVKNCVLRTVDKKVKPHIIHCVHDNDMFLKLQMLYKRDMPEKIEQLMQDYFSFKFTRSANISDLQNIAFKINRLKTDSDLISKILSCLPDDYNFFKPVDEF